jgi:tRNA dimethylallyltransferase
MSLSADSAGVELDGQTKSENETPLERIPVICGPTASGKSVIALWLSLRREIVIISADSRQIYRGFDVGTAKPTREEREKVPHRGIDVVEPTERYSAAQWAEMARGAVGEAMAAGRIPVVVGGTGFYIATLFKPLWAQPAIDHDRRLRIQRLLESASTDELKRWCDTLDPARAHLGRAQLIRAIEIALLTGARLSDLHIAHARTASYSASYLLVDPGGGTELASRIARRATTMFDTGWPKEVRRLLDAVPEDAPAWKATGYAAMRDYVCGKINRGRALENVIIETRQYAKRQRTWFRHQLKRDRVQRLVPDAPGWQETVDRWIADVSGTMSTTPDRVP